MPSMVRQAGARSNLIEAAACQRSHPHSSARPAQVSPTEHWGLLLQRGIDQPVANAADRLEVVPRRAELLPQAIDVGIDGAGFE